jgi:hypothetical protein
MDVESVRLFLARACREAGSARQWAKQHDLSDSYVSDVLSGKRAPSDRILAALSIIRVVTYREIRQ